MKSLNVSDETHTRCFSLLRKSETADECIQMLLFAFEHPKEFMALAGRLHIRTHIQPAFKPSERLRIKMFLTGKNRR